MPAPMIGGNLPWSGGGASMDFSGNPAGLQNSYKSAYDSSLAMNSANYSNILAGYNQTAAAQNQSHDQINAGYSGLNNAVLGHLQGIGASRSQDIAANYAKASGSAAQGLVSRGLGNTTIADSVQQGLTFDKTRADTDLANQLAGQYANYQSNIGLANLGFQANASAQDSNLAQNQLGWLNSVNAGYPNAGIYNQLAQMYGAGNQANADRALAQQGIDQLRGFAPGAGVQRGTTGYTPGGSALTGRPNPASYGASGGGGAFAGGAGSGTPLAMAGNYYGTGTPTAVNAYGTEYGPGLASSLGLAARQGLTGAYGDALYGVGEGYAGPDPGASPDYLGAAQGAAMGGAYGGLNPGWLPGDYYANLYGE